VTNTEAATSGKLTKITPSNIVKVFAAAAKEVKEVNES
jgi:hypothetical protein